MSGFRAFYDFSKNGEPREGGRAELSAEESRHLCGSLRAVDGDRVDIFDLSGKVFECEICGASPKRALVKVLRRAPPAKPKFAVYLAQCLPKGKTFDDIIRQCVEIGAAGIFPLVSERTLVRIENSEKAKKLEKWNSHVVEAVKQSANFSSFEMAEPESLKSFLESRTGGFGLKIAASLRAGTLPILEILRENDAESVCILVGPEGDLTEAEYDAAEKAGFLPATLGQNVMKCDTAAVFAMSASIAGMQCKK